MARCWLLMKVLAKDIVTLDILADDLVQAAAMLDDAARRNRVRAVPRRRHAVGGSPGCRDRHLLALGPAETPPAGQRHRVLDLHTDVDVDQLGADAEVLREHKLDALHDPERLGRAAGGRRGR